MSFLIVGLGNPGTQYDGTRHNIGFAVVDALVAARDAAPVNTKLNAKVWNAGHAFFIEPHTFMNDSGTVVTPFMKMKKIEQTHLVVVHDELDLPFGEVRVSKNSSAAGHNGVQSIIGALGTKEFTRVRVGVGRSATIPPDQYVLARFTVEETPSLPEIIEKAIAAVEGCLLPSKN